MNQLISSRLPPLSWKKSKTCLIPKVNKPRVKEFRPIALANCGYKLFIGMVKENLFSHRSSNNLGSDFQVGFTKGRRLEDNIFLLNYCINETRHKKEALFITAIDFAKAFDSIDRGVLIRALCKMKCHPDMIDVISQLYSGDSTQLYLGNKEIEEIEITSGIRQGCTGSPWLFVSVVNAIISKIVESGLGYRNDKLYIPVLFYADDGLILTQNPGDMAG